MLLESLLFLLSLLILFKIFSSSDEKKNKIIEVTLRKYIPNKDIWIIDGWFNKDRFGFMAAYPANSKINDLFIIVGKTGEGKEKSVGFVGSFNQSGEDELFIYIAQEFRGQGVGLTAVVNFINILPRPAVLMAATKKNNTACRRLLRRAGFYETGPDSSRPELVAYCYADLR